MSNRWGTSVSKALNSDAEDNYWTVGTAYYYGEDGTRAVLDIESSTDITVIVNGSAQYCHSACEACEVFNRQGNVSANSGWSSRP